MKLALPHDCKKELRGKDLKATPARLAAMKLFESSAHPLDVTAIITNLKKQHITIDPATAFRMVNTFTDKGLTKQIQFFEGKYRYELSSKLDHHHLVCEVCGNIEDVSDCSLKPLEKQIKRQQKFLVKHHSLEFYGICENCRT
ncbi:Fur family transcriptional regulator [soil metagenome]